MKKNLRKLISILLILSLLLGIASPSMATSHSFHDVPDGQWYLEAVQFVYANNIMGGVGNSQFNPQDNLTRAQVTALLFRVHNGREANAQDDRENNFSDVGNAWYAPYVTWAFNHSVVFGTSATTFNPHGNVTRQEFATMLHRYIINMTALRVGNAASEQWEQFADRGQIASWAYVALRWMNALGIVTGSTVTTIDPAGTATRAEAAMMMMRFMKRLVEAEFDWDHWFSESSRLIRENWCAGFFGRIIFTVGSPYMRIDSRILELEAGPIIVDDQILLPICVIDRETGGHLGIADRELLEVDYVIIGNQIMMSTDAIDPYLFFEVDWNAGSQEITVTRDFQTRRLLVRTEAGMDFTNLGATDILERYDHLAVLQFATIREAREAYEQLSKLENVIFIQPDRIFHVSLPVPPQSLAG